MNNNNHNKRTSHSSPANVGSVCNSAYQAIESKVQARHFQCSTNKAATPPFSSYWFVIFIEFFVAGRLRRRTGLALSLSSWRQFEGVAALAAALRAAREGGAPPDGQWTLSLTGLTLSRLQFPHRQVNDNGLLSPLVVPGLHFLVSGRWCVLPYPALILLSCGLCLKYQTIKQLFKTVCSLYSDNWQRLIGSHFLSMEFRGEEKLDLGFYLIGVNWSVTQKVCNWYHFLTLHFPAVSRKPERFLFYLLGVVTLHLPVLLLIQWLTATLGFSFHLEELGLRTNWILLSLRLELQLEIESQDVIQLAISIKLEQTKN